MKNFLKKTKGGLPTRNSKSNELLIEEEEFCEWLKDKIINNPSLTKDEINLEILNSKFYKFILMKHFNYKGVLDSFFSKNKTIKPDGYYGEFWVPSKLYDYLIYLDNWVENWYKNPEKIKNTRPKGLYLSGPAKSGKTSLICSMGTFCYWCNIWNFDAYESKPSFNVFDDYDGAYDNKGNKLDNNFHLLKPWFGGQSVVTISGKYRSQTTVSNGRPTIFISNYRFEDRFPCEDDRKYIKSCCEVIDLSDNQTLMKKPNRLSIGGFTGWKKYDTRNSWYFKNILNKQEENKTEKEKIVDKGKEKATDEEIIEISSDPIPPVDLTQEDEHILIKSENEDDIPAAASCSRGRPRKRKIGWIFDFLQEKEE